MQGPSFFDATDRYDLALAKIFVHIYSAKAEAVPDEPRNVVQNFRGKVTVSEIADLARTTQELAFDSIWTLRIVVFYRA